MRPDRRLPNTLWLILAVALALRLLGAWRANLIFDERAHLALAETIDFRPAHFHLVSRTLDHPFLSIYVLKTGSLLFGTSDFALRILHLLAGSLTVVPVYFLGKRIFSEKAGLWAAGLLAVDQFHASWSRVFMPEVLMLLFAALVLLQFLRALDLGRTRDYALLGLLLGLAYLAKEPAILLIPCLWAYLLVTPQHRHLLCRPRWYLAHAVLLAVVAPDVLWNLAQGAESYLYRDVSLATEPFCFSLKPASLYLGEVFRALIGPHVLDPEYEQGSLLACHWPAGLLYLAAILAAPCLAAAGTAAPDGKPKQPAIRLLLVVFFVVFGVFLVMPGGQTFEPYWWASLSLIPAVLCAGWMLARLAELHVTLKLGAAVLVCYLGIHYCPGVRNLARYGGVTLIVENLGGLLDSLGAEDGAQTLGHFANYLDLYYVPPGLRHGPYFPRATVEEFVADFLAKADIAMGRGDLREAQSRFIYVLNISGPNADAYFGLAQVAHRRDKPQKAKAMLLNCLELDPNHQQAIQFLNKTQQPNPKS